jgi:pyruvate dehydrogenase E1 component
VDGKGLSSYPHPKLMPEFWQFPTVSMGLGPLMAIYQARFLKYLHARGIANTENRKVWVFCGDGEMDEPESLGAIGLAARENLDNLVFVINCNLQRLDGPVRGNGKIIQELEGEFRGAGWNVIKLLWGKGWDELLAATRRQAQAAHDGNAGRRLPGLQGQRRRLRAQALLRPRPRALKLVEHMSDDEIWNCAAAATTQKVYAAFHAANGTRASPPCCWSRPSRATAWARPVKARTPCTRPRS